MPSPPACRAASSSKARLSASAPRSAASSPSRSPASRSSRGSSTSSTPRSTSGRSRTSSSTSGTSRPSSATRAEGAVSRRTAFIRNNGTTTDPKTKQAGAELLDHLEPLRPPRLPRAGERPDGQVHRQDDRPRAHGERPGHDGSGDHPPATAARATAASTTPKGTASPARPSARSTATTSRSPRVGSSSWRRTPSRKVEGTGNDGEDLRVQGGRPGRAHRRPGADPLSHPAAAQLERGPAQTTDEGRAPAEAGGGGRPVSARLARGAVGARRRRQVLPLPQRPVRTSTGCRRSAPPRSPRSSCRRSPA